MKLGLCIGINYDGQLGGCENDAIKYSEMLATHMGFNNENISVMLGKNATRKMIIKKWKEFAMITHRSYVETLFISFSGHGTTQADSNGDEVDGVDEVIVPYDYASSGYILDDEINGILKLVSERTTVVGVFDCCHSGTIFDLQYRYIQGDKSVYENSNAGIKAKCLMISGCKDSQVSGEVWVDNQVLGALSAALFITLEENEYTITCWNLLRKLRKRLNEAGYGFQVPQITTSEKLHGTYPFIENIADEKPFLTCSSV